MSDVEEPDELRLFRQQWLAEVKRSVENSTPSRAAALSTAASLPEDVLVAIFFAVAELEPAQRNCSPILAPPMDGSNREWNRTQVLGWVRLSHVCRYWRNILLDRPVLWGRVAFTFPSPNALSVLRNRCQDALIEVCMLKPGGMYIRDRMYYYESVRGASAALERITSLHLHGLDMSDLTLFFRDVPMILLTVLILDLSSVQDSDVARWASDLSYWELRAPQGTSLSLSLKAPALRRLSLTLNDTKCSPDKLKWLAPALRGSPLIESLSLILNLGSYKPQWRALFQDTPVHLIHLTRLLLSSESGMDIPALAQYINPCPPLSFSVLLGGRSAVTPEQVASFSRTFASQLDLPKRKAIFIFVPHVLVGDIPSFGGVAVRAMPVLDEPALFERPLDYDSAVIDGSAMVAVRLSDRDTVLPVLSQEIPSKEIVEQLFVETQIWTDREFWETIFASHVLAHMPAIKTLSLVNREGWMSGQDGSDMVALRMLCGTADQPDVLPNLQTLIVTAPTGSNGVVQWWSHLLAALRHRHSRGIPVRVLRIRGRKDPNVTDLFMRHKMDYRRWVKQVVYEVRDERVLMAQLQLD